MRKRLAQKILSRLVRHGDAIDIYGKQRCVTAYRQYYGYYMFYRIKYAAFKLPEQGTDWKTICTNMYYKRFHKFGAKNCLIRLTPKRGTEISQKT